MGSGSDSDAVVSCALGLGVAVAESKHVPTVEYFPLPNFHCWALHSIIEFIEGIMLRVGSESSVPFNSIQ